MFKNFRTYSIAVDFYRLAAAVKLPGHLKSQLNRASASVALNLQEGSGRFGKKDQKRFFHMAFGSLRECQAIFDLGEVSDTKLLECTDKLAAHMFKLIKS